MTTATDDRQGGERPTGREAVRTAIVQAATRLFSARGMGAVSVRDVAAEAGVNHGLVHRHFGSKAGLVQEVMDTLAASLAAGGPPTRELGGHLEALHARLLRSDYPRLLAHALLEGHAPETLQRAFPVLRGLVEATRAAQAVRQVDPEVDPRVLVSLGAAAGLGWMIFEPFLMTATGVPKRERAAARKQALSLFVEAVVKRGRRSGV